MGKGLFVVVVSPSHFLIKKFLPKCSKNKLQEKDGIYLPTVVFSHH
jgi:hypothetical protein